ncbi:hypothetical protein C806_02658 [Lachnospiraceae bacterium 3-1]|nr:hypothetical protein C806_02658 [Lachnospiraceae bacterium 3-1]
MAPAQDTGNLLETMEKGKTRCRNLRALKLEEWQAHRIANSRKGYWRTVQTLSVAFTNKIIASIMPCKGNKRKSSLLFGKSADCPWRVGDTRKKLLQQWEICWNV